MSRAKKGAASEGQVPAQNEAAESPFSMEQLLKAMEKMQESMDKKFQGLKEEINDRFQALELKQQQASHAGNTGPHGEKSGERDTTEAWRNLESWHNPKPISATQALHDRF